MALRIAFCIKKLDTRLLGWILMRKPIYDRILAIMFASAKKDIQQDFRIWKYKRYPNNPFWFKGMVPSFNTENGLDSSI